MDIRLVDPRDIEYDDLRPHYRVAVWRKLYPDLPDPGYVQDLYDLSDCDVHEVLELTKRPEHADADSIVVEVLLRDTRLGAARLLGIEPTTAAWYEQQAESP